MSQITVIREKAWVAAAMPYKISINGNQVQSLKIGQQFTIETPSEPFTLSVDMVGNSLNISKMKAEVKINPADHPSNITCLITTKLNWIGLITYSLAAPVGDIHINVLN